MPISAEKQQELLDVLNKERHNFSKFDEYDAQKAKDVSLKAEAWAEEISMLKQRVKNNYELLELPGGDVIAIRTCLTEREEEQMGELFTRAFAKGDTSAPYELIELCTANPNITADWLKSHPDEFATQDLLDVLYGYIERKQELRQETADRLMRIASFRIKRDGPKSS
jgi:hypothetical protein